MASVIALVPVDTQHNRLGLASRLGGTLGGCSVLQRTLGRIARVPGIDAIVLVHPPGQDLAPLFRADAVGRPVRCQAAPPGPADDRQAHRRAARLWALTAWRGGLGGATCYDELLPAAPLARAAQEQGAESALLVGGDWPAVDPELCGRVLDLHRRQADAMPLTFTQAPPGLCGIAVGAGLLRQMADNQATFGQALAYNPAKPQADAIGRDVCVQIPAAVRGLPWRFICDTPRSARLLEHLAQQWGERFSGASASDLAAAVLALDPVVACGLAGVPQQISLELTPRREVTGPIVPQHHVRLERPDLDVDLARRVIDQAGAEPDTALTLGGLGDALLHPQWDRIVQFAAEAGIAGVAVETDLCCEPAVLDRLLDLPVDVVSVRLNADTAAAYAQVMGRDGFKKVLDNLQHLFSGRRQRDEAGRRARAGLPWIVPRLVKTTDTLPEMENFFDKWTHLMGQAVIDPAVTGCGLMPRAFPISMAPPRRVPCRQLPRRVTILSDGTAALCDQDWLGREPLGNVAATPLAELWRRQVERVALHAAGRWNESKLCAVCEEWHRP